MNSFLKEYLGKVIPVTFELESGGVSSVIGQGNPEFKVRMHKDISKQELLSSTSLALGEAYMRGDIDIDRDLYEVLNRFLASMDKFSTNRSALKKLFNTSNSKKNQKKEVTAHYDIGNDFYSLWLDETMSYSCGYFKDKDDTLYQAQVNKVDHILQKLQLESGMTLLDIGCGWGFLLIRAAKQYGIKGVGITLSELQYEKCNELIKDEGLEDQISVKLMDYRDLENSNMKFDRVVSVGMIEHVGRANYGLFLKNVDSVLAEEGLFLLHYISSLRENPGDAWIRKYIFPGGTIPSLREIVNILPDYNFYTLDIESLRRHYKNTLLCWRENFLSHREKIDEKMGKEFTRMWELYLASCAANFNNGFNDLHQVLISKGVNNKLVMTRTV